MVFKGAVRGKEFASHSKEESYNDPTVPSSFPYSYKVHALGLLLVCFCAAPLTPTMTWVCDILSGTRSARKPLGERPSWSLTMLSWRLKLLCNKCVSVPFCVLGTT